MFANVVVPLPLCRSGSELFSLWVLDSEINYVDSVKIHICLGSKIIATLVLFQTDLEKWVML